MKLSNKWGVIFFLTSAISFLHGCTDTKFTQCHNLIQITMNIASLTREFSDEGKTNQPKQALLLADAFEEAALEMKSLSIANERLIDYQEGFADMYLGMSQATRDFVSALSEKNLAKAELAQKQLQTLSFTETELLKGMNKYCLEN